MLAQPALQVEQFLQPGQRLRLAAKVRVMPSEFDGQSHPFELLVEPRDQVDVAPVSHTGVFYVPPK